MNSLPDLKHGEAFYGKQLNNGTINSAIITTK